MGLGRALSENAFSAVVAKVLGAQVLLVGVGDAGLCRVVVAVLHAQRAQVIWECRELAVIALVVYTLYWGAQLFLQLMSAGCSVPFKPFKTPRLEVKACVMPGAPHVRIGFEEYGSSSI